MTQSAKEESVQPVCKVCKASLMISTQSPQEYWYCGKHKGSAAPRSAPDGGKTVTLKQQQSTTEQPKETAMNATTTTKKEAGPRLKKVEPKRRGKANAAKAKRKTGAFTIRKSATGEHASIRHLIETLFKKDEDMPYERMEAKVLAEFNGSAFKKAHYHWYKQHIVRNGEWKHVNVK